MLTPAQEQFLADFADKGIAELADVANRNEQVLTDLAVNAAREAKRAELEADAQALIDNGLADFDANVAPSIKPAK